MLQRRQTTLGGGSWGSSTPISGRVRAEQYNLSANRVSEYEALRLQSLLKDVEEALAPAFFDPEVDSASADLTSYLYSDVIPAGHKASGAQITQNIMTGHDSHYPTPRSEAQFLTNHSETLANYVCDTVQDRPIQIVSLGCGPHPSVFTKDAVLTGALRAIGLPINRYLAVDINKGFASRAGKILTEECNLATLSTEYLAQDFSKKMDFTKGRAPNEVPLLYFFGNTTAQFRSKGKGGQPSPLENLFINLNKATKSSGILVVLHSQPGTDAETVVKYKGDLMEQWAKNIWGLLKVAAQDASFDPCAFSYTPSCENGVVSLSFIVRKKTSLTLPCSRSFVFNKGFDFSIGSAEQHSSETLSTAAQKAGWNVMPIRFRDTRHTSGLVFAGKKLQQTTQP